jgi:hypothetical protein
MSPRLIRRCKKWAAALQVLFAVAAGCEMISNRLTRWQMLDQHALEDPLKAVGGDGIVFAPRGEDQPRSRAQLARATPQELVAYYAPVFVQQRTDATRQYHAYPPEYDQIGTAGLARETGGKFKAVVAGPPVVYAIYDKRKIGDDEHIQLTYTAWYPAHPRMKMIDLEEADIDSIVLRVTLDGQNAPLFYETIAACGCFHKVFVARRVEEAAAAAFGAPEKGKKFAVEKTVKDAIDWEVAGVVDEPAEQPRRPVVFIKAGDHHVLGMGSAARLRVPQAADVRPYELAEYAELYAVHVGNGPETAPFFDLGSKVWGAERKERFLLSMVGVDSAGQPRANDKIKLHFDQSNWDDTTIYSRFLRLAPGTLEVARR